MTEDGKMFISERSSGGGIHFRGFSVCDFTDIFERDGGYSHVAANLRSI